MERYQLMEKLGSGQYGDVFKGKEKKTGRTVALKCIKFDSDDEGVPVTAIREISLLKNLNKQLDHPNIVRLLDVFHAERKLTLVFEYLENDLKKYIDKEKTLAVPKIKVFLFQLLEGVAFCHEKAVLHRDLKPQNLLVSNSGDLKIADFGLARAFNIPVKSFSHEVVTLWYRAPDVLLGSTSYDTAIDIWSVGCIFAEMVNGKPLFAANATDDQLKLIFSTFGTPTPQGAPVVYHLLEKYVAAHKTAFHKHTPKPLKSVLPALDDLGIDLISRMLCYDPKDRISAADALEHAYFADLRNVGQ